MILLIGIEKQKMSLLTSADAQALIDEQGLDIIIPDVYTSIDEYAFYGKQLTSVVIPDSVISIGENAFEDNQLTTVVIGDCVTSIGSGAFDDNQITSIVIGNSVTSIGDYAFPGSQLTSIEFPDSVASIGNGAFARNQLTNVVIGDGVTSIGDEAFAENPGLETISISEDATFDLTSLPEGVEIIVREDELAPKDVDSDGFVDSITNYQMWTEFGGVDMQTRRGKTFSDDSSGQWDAIKAVEIDTSFLILLEGDLNKEGKYRVLTASDTGLINGATRWLNEQQMYRNGYEEIFDIDFNGNGEINSI